MSRFCKVCGEEINPLRVKVLPNAVTCVEHSNAGMKRGITTLNGEGDHTYNDIQIVEEEEFYLISNVESEENTSDV